MYEYGYPFIYSGTSLGEHFCKQDTLSIKDTDFGPKLAIFYSIWPL